MRGRIYPVDKSVNQSCSKELYTCQIWSSRCGAVGVRIRVFWDVTKATWPSRWRHYSTSKRLEVLAHQHSVTSETTNIFHHKHVLVTLRSLYFVVGIIIKCTISPLILTLCWRFLTCVHFLPVPSFTTLFKVKQHYISTVCIFLFTSVESSELNNTFQAA